MEPVFESQTKTKLGSTEMGGGLPTVRTYINDFVGRKLDNYLHQNPNVKEQIQKKIIQAEKERKELSGIRKLARERAKKSNLHNKKLRDCRVHLGDMNKDQRLESTLFITPLTTPTDPSSCPKSEAKDMICFINTSIYKI